MKEQKKKKESVLVAESAYISQNAHFGPVMLFIREAASRAKTDFLIFSAVL